MCKPTRAWNSYSATVVLAVVFGITGCTNSGSSEEADAGDGSSSSSDAGTGAVDGGQGVDDASMADSGPEDAGDGDPGPRLTEIAALGISLSPAFSPSITSYTTDVASFMSQTRVYATAESGTATVSIEGETQSGSHQRVLPLGAGETTITVTVSDGSMSRDYTIVVSRAAVPLYLKSPNVPNTLLFGVNTSASGDTFVVGVRGDASTFHGVGTVTNGLDTAGYSRGSVYVFARSGSTWIPQAYLRPAADSDDFDSFGRVAIDGDTLVVGAYGEDSDSTTINGPRNNNGTDTGAAYIFTRTGTTWSQQAHLFSPDASDESDFGNAVAISGDTAVIGAFGVNSNAGAVYVFTRDSGGTWSHQQTLTASNADADDQFGRTVAVSGDQLIVGARYEDSADVATPADNSQTPGSGAAYIFERVGGTWSEVAYLKHPVPRIYNFCGADVAIDGDTAAVACFKDDTLSLSGGYRRDWGSVLIYSRDGSGGWSLSSELRASNETQDIEFGFAMDMAGDWLVAGAPYAASEGGEAFIFHRNRDGGWDELGQVGGYAPDPMDWFGEEVAVTAEGLVFVNSAHDDSDGMGVMPWSNNNAADSGALYIYQP